MADDRGVITGHFISHWGVPTEIRPAKVRGLEPFAILVFAPRGPRKTWRYATNGMSNGVQMHPERKLAVRCELFACTRKAVSWVDGLLSAIATYPLDYDTHLGEGDTISVGQAIDRDDSCYTGILLAPPGSVDGQGGGVIDGGSNLILVHQVVGLLPEEVEFAEEHSGEVLWDCLQKREECVLDEKRTPAV